MGRDDEEGRYLEETGSLLGPDGQPIGSGFTVEPHSDGTGVDLLIDPDELNAHIQDGPGMHDPRLTSRTTQSDTTAHLGEGMSDTHGGENSKGAQTPTISDLSSEREYYTRVPAEQLESFKLRFGVQPEYISSRVDEILRAQTDKHNSSFTRSTELNVQQKYYELEYIAAGYETYLKELQDRATEKGDDSARHALAAHESTFLFEKINALRSYTRELRTCYENGHMMMNRAQLSRIYTKHLYRAHGFNIGAAKDQKDVIQKIHDATPNGDQRYRLEHLVGTTSEHNLSEAQDWAVNRAIPSKYLADWGSEFKRGLRSGLQNFCKYSYGLLAGGVTGKVFLNRPPGTWIRNSWNEGLYDTDEHGAQKKMRFPGYSAPRDSARGDVISIRWLANVLWPGPTIKLFGNNTGSLKFSSISKDALAWAMDNPAAAAKGWYKKARATAMDFVSMLIESGRAKTPEDAFDFYGDEALQTLFIMSVKARAIASGECFYIRKEGVPIKITPIPWDQIDSHASPEEKGLLKQVMDREIFESDKGAMEQHFGSGYHGALQHGEAGAIKRLDLVKVQSYTQSDILNQEQALATVGAKIEKPKQPPRSPSPSSSSG